MKKLTEMLEARPVLCMAVALVLLGIVGAMDYQDATRKHGAPAAASNTAN